MRLLPDGLKAHLETGTTTLCWCWRLVRRDGESYGFTDHDRDLEFDGTRFEAASGMSAGELNDSVGLSVDNVEIDGAIQSDRLAERDLAAGLFDDAAVEVFRVNWQQASQRVLMRRGSLGEVKRSATAFAAEVRGLSHYLQQPNGRLFQYTCDADVGDARCGVVLDQPAYQTTTRIASVEEPERLRLEGASGFARGWFDRGLLTFEDGENAGTTVEIKSFFVDMLGAEVTLWSVPVAAASAGDQVTLQAGCDKHFATCRDTFSNALNFRGFPDMPGNDFMLRRGGL